eukprot:COSAG02_NODE_345_length_24135_cov_6.425404_2_plen_98_part_00
MGCGVCVGYGVWVVATMNHSLLAYCGVPDDPTQTCVTTRPPNIDTASATTIIATSTDMSRQRRSRRPLQSVLTTPDAPDRHGAHIQRLGVGIPSSLH